MKHGLSWILTASFLLTPALALGQAAKPNILVIW